MPNPAVDLAPFGRWTLRDVAAQRRSLIRFERSNMPLPIDINGSPVTIGSTVRLLSLSGQWLEDLPNEERSDVMSMVGEIFVIEEIDEYGYPWVRKSWPNEAEGKCHSHSVALEQHEMEVVQNAL